LDHTTLQLALSRGGYGVKAVTDAVMSEQQQIADAFYNLRLIPKHINVRDATLHDVQAQAGH
jgi:sulfonate transport system substrate-binding protein